MATSKKVPIHEATFPDETSVSGQEESVIRMRNGLGIKDEVLARKTENPELLARLLELERAIYKKATSRKS